MAVITIAAPLPSCYVYGDPGVMISGRRQCYCVAGFDLQFSLSILRKCDNYPHRGEKLRVKFPLFPTRFIVTLPPGGKQSLLFFLLFETLANVQLVFSDGSIQVVMFTIIIKVVAEAVFEAVAEAQLKSKHIHVVFRFVFHSYIVVPV